MNATDIKDKHGFSPLHFASQAGSVDAVQLLLDAGADPSATGLGGIAPLHLAVSMLYNYLIFWILSFVSLANFGLFTLLIRSTL